ncbi:MAG TPA: endolytic transglycosylase MltG [Gordonia sp. (in: high G+C Gram-positive bacteria)]|uniref:endolytic transglycosylase MltG n=1 Tax=unclassified Gordonia (in: high G+C Gram-positive bacteria) TaxID=2657482 RepID=UPI0025B80F6F|nr:MULTISPECIES: endolytic transglycosylase MltG [unclassified Gordonia (in: high G+C Gram-positive bacteria)]HNP57737.1 endolytic transglycosylase MltG [Gordonia sp. (in: high G+C Gram-positive bacteria)]HRC52780.1 endolytic transglycosylase MltG [Gordonia sp. (in: high G+C Gram-positive bacteria)]
MTNDEVGANDGEGEAGHVPTTRHRTRRGESKGLSGAPAWMTGEIRPVDEDQPAPAVRRSASASDTGSDTAPNIVRHTARPGDPDRATPPPVEDGDGEPVTIGADNPRTAPAARVPAWHTDLDDADAVRSAAKQAQLAADPDQMPKRQRSRWLLIGAAALAAVVVLAGGYLVVNRLSGAGGPDYSSDTGTADVLVTIPNNSTLTDFGQILQEAGVVRSVDAFTTAADEKPLSGGVYKLRKGISGTAAVAMMSDSTHRVGRLVVPEGVQLEDKKGVDGKTVPGVFSLIADATATTVNGETIGITVEELETAAKSASATELGVPTWATAAVAKLPGDPRRIEGLIAPGTWEAIDPQASAVAILHKLITDSTQRFEAWGLLTANKSGLGPYELLVAASVAEREVRDTDDLPKVARVILNRLDKKQRLEMDSTANYTAAETNIDVHGDNYKADTRWNTYRVTGLPPTPIATVGEKALKAMLDPPKGKWLYFVTIDKNGTTEFSETFEEHLRNRRKACDNQFLKTGC